MNKLKKCKKCGIQKSSDKFYSDRGYLEARCKRCRNAQTKERTTKKRASQLELLRMNNHLLAENARLTRALERILTELERQKREYK